MSHFTVMVVGPDPEKQLAPFHEFECTGEDDEFIQEIDQTEEARKEYEKNTVTRCRIPDGTIISKFTDEGDYRPEFVRDPTPEESAKHGKMMGMGYGDGISWVSKDWNDGLGYRAKIVQLPEGYTEVEVPRSEVESFAEFCKDWYGHEVVPFGTEPDIADKHKYGYTLVDENGEVIKTVDRTNPEAHWDWYQIGGRWNGFFKMKPQTIGVLGEASAVAVGFDKDYKPPTADRADIAMKGDIDIDGMRDQAAEKANEDYDLYEKVTAGTPSCLTWQEVQAKHQTGELLDDGDPKINWEAARKEYREQPRVAALQANSETLWFNLEDFQHGRAAYVQEARDAAFSTFAVIKDGKWYERGEMGWWGAVRGEKNEQQWGAEFSKLIDNLPDDTMLTVVDCHI